MLALRKSVVNPWRSRPKMAKLHAEQSGETPLAAETPKGRGGQHGFQLARASSGRAEVSPA
jgi:hypothetical protein